MNIVHVVATYPPQVGGMEKAVQELAERSAKGGHDVTVFTANYNNTQNAYLSDNLKICRLWSVSIPGIPVIIPMLPVRLLQCINRHTIVHIHYILNFSMDIAILTARLKRAKIVSHIRIDPLPTGPFGFLNPIYKRLIWRRILPLSDIIICHTSDYADIISCKYNVPRSKCISIPNGINVANFKRKNYYDILLPVKILFVGRLHKQKNIPRLIEAFRMFKQKYDSVLHIVGDGEERQNIEDLIKYNNIDNVVLHGALEGEKLSDVYCSCDIFVLPSDCESFGNVNLEAMTSGLPIIASDIPGVHNLLDGSAILVKPTPANFAAAMAMMVEDDQLRLELIRKSFAKVTEYDWGSTVNKIIDVYHKLNN